MPMKSDDWFRGAQGFWANVHPDVDGMLGGLGELSSLDLETSRVFLKQSIENGAFRIDSGIAFDVGAGIGRISSNLLLDFLNQVVLLEPEPSFVSEAQKNLGSRCIGSVPRVIQDFDPKELRSDIRFDLIWIQWVLIYVSNSTILHLTIFSGAS